MIILNCFRFDSSVSDIVTQNISITIFLFLLENTGKARMLTPCRHDRACRRPAHKNSAVACCPTGSHLAYSHGYLVLESSGIFYSKMYLNYSDFSLSRVDSCL